MDERAPTEEEKLRGAAYRYIERNPGCSLDGKDVKWTGTYQPLTEGQRALVLAERIELHAAAVTWSKRHGVQMNLELLG